MPFDVREYRLDQRSSDPSGASVGARRHGAQPPGATGWQHRTEGRWRSLRRDRSHADDLTCPPQCAHHRTFDPVCARERHVLYPLMGPKHLLAKGERALDLYRRNPEPPQRRVNVNHRLDPPMLGELHAPPLPSGPARPPGGPVGIALAK